MNIIVTGGAGFIGSNIADELILDGNRVVIIDNLEHGKREYLNSKAEFFECDILSQNINSIFEKVKPDIVIHHAAQISVGKSCKNPIKDANTNIVGSINILESCKNNNVKKIIYPASAAIFGEPKYFPIDEKHPLNMLSPYGVSKHTVEHYLEVYYHLYGINYNSLRYSNVYGPRQDSTGEGGVVSIFCENMIKGITPTIYGDGNQTRDFVYVKDVVEANKLCIISKNNGIYNVCTNTQTSVNELYKLIKNEINYNGEVIHKPERMEDIKHSYMTYEKINKELGWQPQINIMDAIKNTIDYYRNF